MLRIIHVWNYPKDSCAMLARRGYGRWQTADKKVDDLTEKIDASSN